MNRFMSVLFVALVLGQGTALAAAAESERAPELVIYDNDWSVSTGGQGYVSEPALAILLADPEVRVLGLTSVSGDYWRDEGVASLLRFLEIIGAPGVPVHNGAALPLVNSAERHAEWEARYGKAYWSGAWNDAERDPLAHAQDPWKIIPPLEGMPALKPAAQNAVSFLIEAVHRHPGQVTIYAEGPLTNIALALRQDPSFASLVRRIIIQGSSVGAAHEEADKRAEFNFQFDPEAADIVLTAPWREAVLLGDISNRTELTPALLARMVRIDTPAGRYATANASPGLPLWSQLGAAMIVDPAIVRAAVPAVVAVSLDHGAEYGRTRSWPAGHAQAPALGHRPVTIVTDVDSARLADLYVESLSRPIRRR
jgi:inosine-uridine nucleoside N-ribohydrolase